MKNHSNENNNSLWNSKFLWSLILVMVVVLILAVFSWRSPISKPTGERMITLTVTSEEPEQALVQTPQVELILSGPEDFLNPEEIGHTDGIIVWGTVLMMILLLATLREIILRKKNR